MVSQEYFDNEQKVHEMTVRNRRAKLAAGARDRWGLPPAPKGWLRGETWEIRQRDEPCQFGALQILEFELREDPKQPGIPVRMSGTYIDGVVRDGSLVDVPDPHPSRRPTPMEPTSIIHSWSRYSSENRIHKMTAYYPGRQGESLVRSRWLGLVTLALPAIGLAAAILALYFYHIVD